MADDGRLKKQEEDFTEAVDAAMPGAVALSQQDGKLREALDSLLPLEKKARMASDVKSVSRILEGIVTMSFEAKDWDCLGEYVIMLAKRRGQLKQAMTKMIRKACEYLEQAPDKATTLKLIDTLRTVTAGKIHVEIERARLTLKLSKMKEEEGNIQEAADVLHELQVETFGSMERREKVEFILEQMRLGLARGDFIRTQIISKKINIRVFKKDDTEDLKLKYYALMKQLAQHDSSYLDMCKYNREIFDTPSVVADEAQWKAALRDAALYIVLAPYSSEQTDLVARLNLEEKLGELPVCKQLLARLVQQEVVPWRVFEDEFSALRSAPAFDAGSEIGTKQWGDLRSRVVEHNIRIIAQYYTRITIARLSELLELPAEESEKFLSQLVTQKVIFAKTDRPSGIIVFKPRRDPAEVLNGMASGLNSLLGLVDKTTHIISKERMVGKIAA